MAKTLTQHDTAAFEGHPRRPHPASAAPGVYLTPALCLVRPLGEGGMGSVWVADHRGLLAEVVVKVISKSVEGRPDAAARFAAEAAAAAAIKSPHVVTVFDYGVTESGTPYIVMELLEGEDLGARIARGGRLDPREVVAIVVQMSRALTKAHRAGVVHRDIKPENIFLCQQDGAEIFVKLLDFGTAKSDRAPTPSTSPGELLGTPYYMSPEQIASAGEVDARTDVWALGVVAFEALTGKKPFDGGTVAGITLAIHSALPRLTAEAPDLPIALDAWFARACAREPDDRYSSAREAAEAFYEAITGTPFPENADSVPILPATPGEIRIASAPPPRAKLSESLPKRGSERRPIVIAAGLVTAAAALTMIGVVAGWSAPPKASADSPPPNASADPTPKAAAAATTNPSPPPSASAASTAEAKKPAPRSPPAAPPPTREARSPAARPRRSPHRKGDGTGHDTAGHEDDDLLQLQQVDPGPAPAPAPSPTPSPTSVKPAAPSGASPTPGEPPPLPPGDPAP